MPDKLAAKIPSEFLQSLKINLKPKFEPVIEPISHELDWNKAMLYLNNVKSHLMQFRGKAGYNPFPILYRIRLLEASIADNFKTTSLYNEIMAFKQKPPSTKDVKFRPTESLIIKL